MNEINIYLTLFYYTVILLTSFVALRFIITNATKRKKVKLRIIRNIKEDNKNKF